MAKGKTRRHGSSKSIEFHKKVRQSLVDITDKASVYDKELETILVSTITAMDKGWMSEMSTLCQSFIIQQISLEQQGGIPKEWIN